MPRTSDLRRRSSTALAGLPFAGLLLAALLPTLGCRQSQKVTAPRIPEPIADPFLGPGRLPPPPLYVPQGPGSAPSTGTAPPAASGDPFTNRTTAPPPPTSTPAAPAAPASPLPGPSDTRPLPGPTPEASGDRSTPPAAVPSGGGAPAKPEPPPREADRTTEPIRRTAAWVEADGNRSTWTRPRPDPVPTAR